MKTTGLTVSYGRADLLKTSIESIRKFYDFPILIIDGSPIGSECYNYVHSLHGKDKIKVIAKGKNIGHGRGIDLGMKTIRTKHVLLFDTDIEMLYPCVKVMLELIGGAYGVGEIQSVNKKGFNIENGLPYLHPYFCLINRKVYFEYPKAIHHGSPMIKAMKAEPEIVNYPAHWFIKHLWKGTRSLNPKEFRNWESH